MLTFPATCTHGCGTYDSLEQAFASPCISPLHHHDFVMPSREAPMSKHDHPEACQHTLAYCEHCRAAYCTQCNTQWAQAPLPEMALAAPPVGPHEHEAAAPD